MQHMSNSFYPHDVPKPALVTATQHLRASGEVPKPALVTEEQRMKAQVPLVTDEERRAMVKADYQKHPDNRADYRRLTKAELAARKERARAAFTQKAARLWALYFHDFNMDFLKTEAGKEEFEVRYGMVLRSLPPSSTLSFMERHNAIGEGFKMLRV